MASGRRSKDLESALTTCAVRVSRTNNQRRASGHEERNAAIETRNNTIEEILKSKKLGFDEANFWYSALMESPTFSRMTSSHTCKKILGTCLERFSAEETDHYFSLCFHWIENNKYITDSTTCLKFYDSPNRRISEPRPGDNAHATITWKGKQPSRSKMGIPNFFDWVEQDTDFVKQEIAKAILGEVWHHPFIFKGKVKMETHSIPTDSCSTPNSSGRKRSGRKSNTPNNVSPTVGSTGNGSVTTNTQIPARRLNFEEGRTMQLGSNGQQYGLSFPGTKDAAVENNITSGDLNPELMDTTADEEQNEEIQNGRSDPNTNHTRPVLPVSEPLDMENANTDGKTRHDFGEQPEDGGPDLVPGGLEHVTPLENKNSSTAQQDNLTLASTSTDRPQVATTQSNTATASIANVPRKRKSNDEDGGPDSVPGGQEHVTPLENESSSSAQQDNLVATTQSSTATASIANVPSKRKSRDVDGAPESRKSKRDEASAIKTPRKRSPRNQEISKDKQVPDPATRSVMTRSDFDAMFMKYKEEWKAEVKEEVRKEFKDKILNCLAAQVRV